MADVEIYGGLTQIVREVLQNDAIVLAPETLLDDIPAWDSLLLVLVGLDAETRFGIELATHELERLVAIGDFVDLIRRKLKAG